MDMLFLTFSAAAIALGVLALMTVDDDRERDPEPMSDYEENDR